MQISNLGMVLFVHGQHSTAKPSLYKNSFQLEGGIGYMPVREAVRAPDNQAPEWFWSQLATGRPWLPIKIVQKSSAPILSRVLLPWLYPGKACWNPLFRDFHASQRTGWDRNNPSIEHAGP